MLSVDDRVTPEGIRLCAGPHTLPQATAETKPFLVALRALASEALPLIRQRGLTLVGMSITNLDDDDAVQLELPFTRAAGPLEVAVDGLRDRFGASAVTRAVLLGRDPGLTMPMLPDPPRPVS